MANDRKRGFFSSLFGSRKRTEEEEAAQQESKQRLEARIEQILAEKVAVREILAEKESQPELVLQPEEVEPEVELLPISASVVPIRKMPAQSAFVLAAFESPRSYAANER